MVVDPIPQSLPVHFFGSRPQPPTSPIPLPRRVDGGYYFLLMIFFCWVVLCEITSLMHMFLMSHSWMSHSFVLTYFWEREKETSLFLSLSLFIGLFCLNVSFFCLDILPRNLSCFCDFFLFSRFFVGLNSFHADSNWLTRPFFQKKKHIRVISGLCQKKI